MFAASKTDGVSGGYQISRSLRFNSADSAYLNRTPASAGSRTTWTWSGWVKRSTLGARNGLFVCTNGGATSYTALEFNASDQLTSFDNNASGSTSVVTTQVFRDVSAWYHIVWVYDTTQATASNRVKLYLNGTQITSFGTADYPTQNSNTYINSTNSHSIGSWNPFSPSFYLNGYMTEVNFIDGQALTPSSFGETNAQTGVWQPKAYSGSYGTNGFYLNFSDNSNTTAATLGKDYSGNGNNWTPNNFSVTAGAGNDSLVDSPTAYGFDTGVGGTVRGNYCTLNQLDKGPTYVLTNGNLDATTSHTTDTVVKTTMAVNSGKWYAEIVYTTIAGNYPTVGIVATTFIVGTNAFVGVTSTSYGYGATGVKLNNASTSGYGASWTTGDVIGIAFDLDAGTITFYKNGTSQGVAFTGIPLTNSYCLAFSTVASVNAFTTNFGQRPFAYTAPSGYKALCTQNLPTPTIGATTATQAGKYFNPVLFNKSSFPATVTGVGFQPDLTWWKARSAVQSNVVFDVIRGSNSYLLTNTTDAEATQSGAWTANSDGWTSQSGAFSSSVDYVAWNWKANGSGSTNTAGSITSTVSANTTSGFSIVTFAAAASSTVGHGLGVTPSMVVVKSRTVAGNYWITYHVSTGATGYLAWNTTDAFTTNATVWNNTAPTSTVFTIGSGFTNASYGNCVAYCFAEVAGYSKFGSWTGNASTDGPFVFTGFRPAYVMWKRTDVANDWVIVDATRSTYNQTANVLYAEDPAAENTTGVGNSIDILSNGFKLRQTNNGSNASGGTYIFMAFATSPFKYSLAR